MLQRNNISVIMLMFSGFLLYSCERLWVESEEEWNLPVQESTQIQMLNGIYYLINEVQNENYFYLLSRSDDVNIFSYMSDHCQLGECNLENIIADFYQQIYRAIIAANKLQAYVDPLQNPELYGEVLFLEAYCYFKLSRLFHKPPLIDNYEVSYSVNYLSRPEIYQKTEEILKTSLLYLPESKSEARLPGESPHVGTANALLAELYLSWAGYPLKDEGKYFLAMERAGSVIDHSIEYGFSFVDDYSELWKSRNGNPELIFGTFFNKNLGIVNRIYPGTLISQINDTVYDIETPYVPEFNYFFNSPDGYRKELNFRTGNYRRKMQFSPDSNYYIYKLEKVDSSYTYWDFAISVFYKKWLQEDGYGKDPLNTDQPLVLLRYTQTRLTWAESKVMINQADDQVIEVINRIRRRARKLPVAEPSSFDLPENLSRVELLQSIRQERAWELCMEPEGRWFDIVRLELLDELDKQRNPKDQKVTFDAQLSPDPYFLKNPIGDKWLTEEIQNHSEK